MKNLYKALASAAIVLLAASCVNEMANDTTDGLFRKYNLSFEGSTKTELSGTGNTRQVKWTNGDEITFYTKDHQSSASTASVTADDSSAWVEIPLGRNDDFLNAVYGAGSIAAASSTSDCMYVGSPAKDSQSYTTFAQAHLCAAFSDDLEDPNLRFHNAVSILKFTSAASVSKVVFSGNNGEVITGGSNGSLTITYSGGAVSAAPSSSGGTSVTVTTADQESDFYIAILPVNFSEGITIRGYDASGYLLCERKTSGELNTINASGRPIIANLGSIQEWLDNPKPTAIDLGLSVKWASFNLGASTPESSGDFFSWGETAPKSSYTWSTYSYGQSKNGPFSEYVADAAHGTSDHKIILDPDDDAAHAVWGDSWRMPSKEEFQELNTGCTWTWTTMNGVSGYKITGKKSGYTGNFIFLPAAGMMSGSKVQNAGTEGDYWSSSLYSAESCSSWSPYFTASEFSTGDCYRYFGLPVRAVYGEVVPVAEITLPETLILTMGIKESETLSATILPDYATYRNLTWVSSDSSVAVVDASGKVTAVALGTATVTVFSVDGSKSAQCEVSVNQQIESITLDKESLDIFVGDEPVAFIATVLPEENTDKDLNWTSSNTAVATVDEEGHVSAVSAGTATITATAKDGSEKNATCTVTVYNHVSSISLNKTEMTIYTGKTATLIANVLPETAKDKSVVWSSDNESIAIVSQTGVVSAIAPGATVVNATTTDGSLSASCKVTVIEEPMINGHEYVDLGLPSGLKWAYSNVGADYPEGYGDSFAWGETRPKYNYSWSTYKWCKGSSNSQTKYCTSNETSYWGGSGSPDNKTVLDSDDDAASANWGGSWRMPTNAEWTELRNNCTWTWTDNYNGTGIAGQIVTSNMPGYESKSIFLPATGYRDATGHYYVGSNSGNYWSSSLSTGSPSHAGSVYFSSASVSRISDYRYHGLSVRPVTE